MAVATGAVVANLYYCQPLLHQIALSFHVGSGAASTIVTFTQVGYAAGLVLVVPLGDMHPRRTLAVIIYLVAAVALVGCALAGSMLLFGLASLAVGLSSVAGQVMVPFAADLATPERRGRVVARIMSGLLLGILMARTVAGLVAELFGWRAIYWLSAALMVFFALILRKALPGEAERPSVPYGRLVSSSLRLLVDLPALRRRAFLGACAFGAFSVLWTAVAFLLSGPPYGYSEGVIGLFGLAGVAGVVAANLAGKLADSHRIKASTWVAGTLLVGSFALMAIGRTSLVALVLGIVVLDMGTQGMQITNQAVIYALMPEARSRINSAYMFCYFVGGALGSVLAGLAYAHFHWNGVCVLGAVFGVLSLGMATLEQLRPAQAVPSTEIVALDGLRARTDSE
jgi:predicted MFS family arabinose efflux permease